MKQKIAGKSASTSHGVKAAVGRYCAFSYDDADKIIFITHPRPVTLGTSQEIVSYFDDCVRFWRDHCRGQRIYAVIDYENLTSSLNEIDTYTAQVKRMLDECTLAIVRYSGGILQRTVSRMTAIQLHTPSNVYSSRAEAVAVVLGLRRGTLLASSGAAR
jgi:hypothetical protein